MLDILESVSENYKTTKINNLIFYALNLLSLFREQRAFPYIIKFLKLPKEYATKIFDEDPNDPISRNDIISGFPKYITSTYNGDLSALKSIIENPSYYVWSRIATVDGLIGLVAINKLSREEVLSYLVKLLDPKYKDEDGRFLGIIAHDICHLWPYEFKEEIIEAFNNGLLTKYYISRKTLDETLANDKDDHLKKRIYDRHDIFTISSIKDMKWISGVEEKWPFLDKENEKEFSKKLFTACSQGDIKKVEEIFFEPCTNIDPDVQDENGMTPLMHAALNGNNEIIRLLLKGDADIDMQDNNGKTAFVHAYDKNQSEVMLRLLLAEADISIKPF